MEPQYVEALNSDIKQLFKNALSLTLRNPAMFFPLIKALFCQNRAVKTRLLNRAKGISVPPVIIFSVTNSCNLRCAGCYSIAEKRKPAEELDNGKITRILSEAQALGTSIVLLTGGEPLLRKGLLDVISNFDKMVFILFTNGILIGKEIIEKLKLNRHIIPILSIEGKRFETDSRRGGGIFDSVKNTMKTLRQDKILFGSSLTVTNSNYSVVLDEDFIKDLISTGNSLVFFVEYVPVEPGTESLAITQTQQNDITEKVKLFGAKYPALFFSFPSGEERYGGCLSSGRGFIHIDPAGNLEPCPFAPYSDINLTDVPLSEALNSNLLKTIRGNHGKLNETKGGCALWQNRDWISSLSKKS